MHARTLDSAALQRTLRVLKRGGAYTTRELRRASNIEAVSATVSELRQRLKKKRLTITCKRRGRYFYYMLART